jgi:predicted Mrr-cat superfamily restriction endonuclease
MPSPHATQFPEPQVWEVWPGRDDDTTEQLDLKEQTTSMAWDNAPDPTPFATRDAFKAELKRLIPGESERWYGKLAYQVWAFAYDIVPGHYILMPMRKRDAAGHLLFSFGVVTDTYEHKPERKDGMHIHKIRWLYTHIPRDVIKVWQVHPSTVTRMTDFTPTLATAFIVNYVLTNQKAQPSQS